MITLGRKWHYFPETLSLDSRTVVDSSFMISFARTQELFGFWRVPAYARGICKKYCPYCPTVHHCCLRYFHIDKDFLFLGRRYEETGRQENFRTTNLRCGSITKPIRLVYRLEKVFDTQVKGFGYLMKPQERRLWPHRGPGTVWCLASPKLLCLGNKKKKVFLLYFTQLFVTLSRKSFKWYGLWHS